MQVRDRHYVPGDWYIYDDITGLKLRAQDAVKTWDGYWTNRKSWEPRQPQDFVRGVKDVQAPVFIRHPPDVFIGPGDVTATML